MKTTDFDDDDTLVVRFSDKPVVREVSQDWRTHLSYAADGSVVQTVILEARECGAWPLSVEHRTAARTRLMRSHCRGRTLRHLSKLFPF